ncbi:MAG TPA: LytTR family DNA-binding domain-containing protein [Sphingomicrobium sp.]|nr:LytTR family DNA-binding domain-containing protein [Sphingomicrobium sp.]
MLDALRRPLSLPALLAGVTVAALLVAAYCLGYTALAGRPETLTQSLGWAIANVIPWLLAIESGKRVSHLPSMIIVLGAALLGSILLGYALGVSDDPLPFEAWRRAPALATVAGLIALLRSPVGRRERNGGEIPLLPRQIDWIQAAGNYVELRASGQTVVHRSSISAAERDLAMHGFIRIHRSTLVQRDRIARVRRHDVILTDGTHLKIGKRYRATLNS